VARLYANENFPQVAVQHLRALGHDVVTVLEAGNANAGISDAEVLGFAASNERTVITLNRRDFVQLHMLYQKTQQEHFGIIVCTQDGDVARQAENVHAAITTAGNLFNQLIRVNRHQA
jgi:predicted nuclease of predicted toxin-antitoxin system